MKKLLITSLLALVAINAQADAPQLVNADGSELSAICIAAITSREAMYDKAAELGVRNFEPGEMRCNGQTISRFISIHRAMATVGDAPAGFVFSKSDDTPVTELCMAAIRSEQEYRAVKARLFADEDGIEAEVRCNGMSLANFARRYRTAVSTVSLR
ncbi:MAG TPA: hypothetical protein VGE69_02620 [Pseudomonadales bacterium]